MAFASGKFAYGLCDYCGQRYKLNDLQKNWKGFKVCPQDYEPKEPQLEPLKYKGDAIALFEPRPDRAEPMQVYVGIVGDMAFESVGMQPAPVGKPIAAKGAVGKVTVAIS
jgi:hypothetical protein